MRPDSLSAVSTFKAGIFCAALVLCFAVLSSGCVSASTSQSVQDWNAWSALQQNFSKQAEMTLKTLDDHHTTLNAAIISRDPEFASLRQNLASDRESLELWMPQMMALDSAATRFYANASLLNGSAYDTAQRMNANINRYLTSMNAARIELENYCTSLNAYLADGDLDYADESQRSDADTARQRAITYLNQANDALTALDTDAKILERAQTVI
jgi:hypothetical protein